MRGTGPYLGGAYHLADCELLDEQEADYVRHLVITTGSASVVWAIDADGSLIATSSVWGERPGGTLALLESHVRGCGIYEAYPDDDGGVACDGSGCLLLAGIEVPERLTSETIREMIEG